MLLEVTYTLSSLILVTGLNCTGPNCDNTSTSTQQNCTNGQCSININVSDNSCTGPNCDVTKNCTGGDCTTKLNCTGSACKQIVNCTQVGYTEIKGDCIKGISLNEHCETEITCQAGIEHSECNSLLKICMCRPGYERIDTRGSPPHCKELENFGQIGEVDLAMVFILFLLCSMFIIICIVFQMFAKERFQDNRTIFNTPNPRLMNASFSAKDMVHRRKPGGSFSSEEAKEERQRRIERIRSLHVENQEQESEEV